MKEKIEQLAKLNDGLCKSIQIRKAYNLPMTGIVRVKLIKPAGVSDRLTKKEEDKLLIMKIYHGIDLVYTLPLGEHKANMLREFG